MPVRLLRPLALAAAGVLLAGCSASEEGGEGEPGREAGSSAASPTTPGAESAAPVSDLRYVALGDSYTSAPGVGDATGPLGCLQTDGNYPHLLQERLGVELVDVSCAGATSRDLRAVQQSAGEGAPAQLDALTRDTDLVTLSIGANDAGLFGDLVAGCARLGGGDAAPCSRSARFAPARLDAEMTALARETARSVRAVERRAPRALVVVVGYPQIVPATGTCAALPIDAVDVPLVHAVNERLADALETGARRAGASYVDMWAASAGHDICADEPWIAGLRPAGPAAPFHPYAAHQAAVADRVAALVD